MFRFLNWYMRVLYVFNLPGTSHHQCVTHALLGTWPNVYNLRESSWLLNGVL